MANASSRAYEEESRPSLWDALDRYAEYLNKLTAHTDQEAYASGEEGEYDHERLQERIFGQFILDSNTLLVALQNAYSYDIQLGSDLYESKFEQLKIVLIDIIDERPDLLQKLIPIDNFPGETRLDRLGYSVQLLKFRNPETAGHGEYEEYPDMNPESLNAAGEIYRRAISKLFKAISTKWSSTTARDFESLEPINHEMAISVAYALHNLLLAAWSWEDVEAVVDIYRIFNDAIKEVGLTEWQFSGSSYRLWPVLAPYITTMQYKANSKYIQQLASLADQRIDGMSITEREMTAELHNYLNQAYGGDGTLMYTLFGDPNAAAEALKNNGFLALIYLLDTEKINPDLTGRVQLFLSLNYSWYLASQLAAENSLTLPSLQPTGAEAVGMSPRQRILALALPQANSGGRKSILDWGRDRYGTEQFMTTTSSPAWYMAGLANHA